jgi:Cu-Zn family superoxide dismutase
MPMLRSDASGAAKLVWEADGLTVTDGPASVVGKGVIVHRDPDDYKTQPTGNAGPRLACGVVKRM